ncbi:MAG: uroporphyrinogen-III C-methyltransferase [Pirellulales bacterium]
MPIPQPTTRSGRVVLVGAGPGDAGLITLRGRERIVQADEILYDYLVNPAILEAARADCEIHCLGQHGTSRSSVRAERLWTQEAINQRLIESARAGRMVVRLKSGDPAIFGRLAEECAVLDEAGVPYEIVPGITAALAAGPYAGVWITHRDAASAVALVTGHEKAGQVESKLDFAALAAFPGTLVFYMGVTTARTWSSALIDAGKSPATPVVVVRRCSWPDQRIVRSTLAQVADDLEVAKIRPPVISVVGADASIADGSATARWFVERPLFGQKILTTRPAGLNDSLTKPLSELVGMLYAADDPHRAA